MTDIAFTAVVTLFFNENFSFTIACLKANYTSTRTIIPNILSVSNNLFN